VRAIAWLVSSLWSALAMLTLLLGAAAVVAVRAGGVSGAAPGSVEALRTAAAESLEHAISVGGSGLSFEVIQRSTLYAKPGGPRIELRDPADPKTIIGVADQYEVGSILSRGGVTADAFWMELSVATKDQPANFSAAEFFARVLERDGKLWRDDGVGWYLTEQSPGVGMDPATARLLPGLLRSLSDAAAIEPAQIDGRLLTGIRGTSTPAAFPGVIAADGAALTEESFGVDCWFDDQGRLVRLEARARNIKQPTYDLVADTVVTFSYGAPGDPPNPAPTMAPEVPPTSEPEAAGVQP
jgi:hypothetical protein